VSGKGVHKAYERRMLLPSQLTPCCHVMRPRDASFLSLYKKWGIISTSRKQSGILLYIIVRSSRQRRDQRALPLSLSKKVLSASWFPRQPKRVRA